MPAASLTKVDTTSQSWLVLPKTQGITGYRCVCLSRAAQLQSWGLAVSLVSLSQACCWHRRHSCATSAFCAIEAVHRKVCWLTCCVRKDRRLNTDLRFALAPKLGQAVNAKCRPWKLPLSAANKTAIRIEATKGFDDVKGSVCGSAC